MNSDRNPEQVEGSAQHELIVRDAENRGIEIIDVTDKYGKSATLLKYKNREELLLQGIPNSWMNDRAVQLCDQKHLTKELFCKLDIPTLESTLFSDPYELKTLDLFDGKTEYVCKPIIGTNGQGVVLNIKSLEDVEKYYSENKMYGAKFMLEEMHYGYDLRIQVIGGDIIAACMRIPGRVIGDGVHTLQELIDVRKKEIKLQNPANDLYIDAQSLALIREQGYEMSSVISEDAVVVLKKISNMAQGGHAIDVTGAIDPVFSDWVAKITHELGTGYFALDVMCSAHDSHVSGNAVALELNIRAEWMHHTFSEGRTHNLEKTIVDRLFESSDA